MFMLDSIKSFSVVYDVDGFSGAFLFHKEHRPEKNIDQTRVD